MTEVKYQVNDYITPNYACAQAWADRLGVKITRLYIPVKEKPATSEKFEQIMAKKRKENKW